MRRIAVIVSFLLLTAVALLQMGCTTLAHRSAPFVGCPASQVVITNQHQRINSRSWTASCNGRRFECGELRSGNNVRQVHCASPEPERVVVVERTAPRTAGSATGTAPTTTDAPTSAVTRTVREGVAVVRTEVAVEAMNLVLAASPARDAERLWFAMRIAGTDGQRRACQIGMLVDGSPRPITLERYEYAGGLEELREIMALDDLRSLGTASRVAIRICDAEWRLDAADLATVREFVARVDEERAWQSSGAAAAH